MKSEKCFVAVITASFLLAMLVLSGCVPATSNLQTVPIENAANKGRVSFFLNLHETDGPKLSMQISAIQLKAQNGTLVTHTLDSLVVESGKVDDGQKFLTRMVIPPGNYTQVQLVVVEAGYVNEQGNRLVPLKDSEVMMEFRSPFNINVGDSKSLFFTWDTKESIVDKQFSPAIKVAPSLRKLIADVAYVACPNIDTVFMISTEKNRVIDSLAIQGGPTYLFQNNDSRSDEVYVLAHKGLRLDAFSPTTNRVTEKYSLTMLNNPVHAAISQNGRWGYVVDKQLGTVSRMDLTSGTIDKEVNLNFAPVYLIYLEKYNLVAVSLSIAQSVVLLNADTMEQAGTISTGTSPEGLMFLGDKLLYVAERGSNSVMIYDLEANSMVKRVSVGFQPRRILKTNNYVYVANYGNNTISTLRYGGLTVSRSIPFQGKPLEMAYVSNYNSIYIGNPRTMSLEVFNSLSNEMKGNIELGAIPEGILVLEDQRLR